MQQRYFQPVGVNPAQSSSVQSSSVDGEHVGHVTTKTANAIGCGGGSGFAIVSGNGSVGGNERYVTSFPQYAPTSAGFCRQDNTIAAASTGCYGDCSSSQPAAFYERLMPTGSGGDGQYHSTSVAHYVDSNCYTGFQQNQFSTCHFQPIHHHQQQQMQQLPPQGMLDYRYQNMGHVTPVYSSPGPNHRCLPSVPQYTVPLHYTGSRHIVIQQVIQPEIVDQSGAAMMSTMAVQQPATLTQGVRCHCVQTANAGFVTSQPEVRHDDACAFQVQSHGCRRISACHVMMLPRTMGEEETGSGDSFRRPEIDGGRDQFETETAGHQFATSDRSFNQGASSGSQEIISGLFLTDMLYLR